MGKENTYIPLDILCILLFRHGSDGVIDRGLDVGKVEIWNLPLSIFFFRLS